jgi:hypothetical protein
MTFPQSGIAGTRERGIDRDCKGAHFFMETGRRYAKPNRTSHQEGTWI